jgi:hypothetical protein
MRQPPTRSGDALAGELDVITSNVSLQESGASKAAHATSS